MIFPPKVPPNSDMFGLSVLAFNPQSYGSNGVPSGGTENMSQSETGLDAEFSVNGIEMYRSSNTVTDAIPGVTLNLLQAETTPGAADLSLNVSASSSSLASELTSFVSAYNTAMSTINVFYQPVPAGQQPTSTNTGILSGDSGLFTLSNILMNSITTSYGTEQNQANNSLVYLGLSFSDTSPGVMQFDSSQLSSAYQTDSANITTMINNMASSLGSSLDNYIKTVIPAEQNNYQTQITTLQSQYTSLQNQLSMEQTNLTTEYSGLLNTVTTESNIGSFLTEETNLLTNPKSY